LLAGGWLGLGYGRAWNREEAQKLARIRLDIPNSADTDWKIDIRKATARVSRDSGWHCPPAPTTHGMTWFLKEPPSSRTNWLHSIGKQFGEMETANLNMSSNLSGIDKKHDAIEYL